MLEQNVPARILSRASSAKVVLYRAGYREVQVEYKDTWIRSMRLQVLATPRLLSVPFRRHRGVSCIHSASETNWFQQCRITCQVDGGHGEDLWGRVYNISALRELADGEILDGAAACAEARLLQRSNHKHVAPLRDVVLAPEAGLLVLVWSYFSGGSLLERFERLCSNGAFRQPPHLPCRERCDPAGVGLRAGADLIDSLCFRWPCAVLHLVGLAGEEFPDPAVWSIMRQVLTVRPGGRLCVSCHTHAQRCPTA